MGGIKKDGGDSVWGFWLSAKGERTLWKDLKFGSDVERFEVCSFVCFEITLAPRWRIDGSGVGVNVRRTTALEQSGGKVVLGLGSNKGEGQKRTDWMEKNLEDL